MQTVIAQYKFDKIIYDVFAIHGGYLDPYSLDNVTNFLLKRNGRDVLTDCDLYFGQLTVPTYEQVARFERNEGQFHTLLKRADPT
jgi:hypothetical protein